MHSWHVSEWRGRVCSVREELFLGARGILREEVVKLVGVDVAQMARICTLVPILQGISFFQPLPVSCCPAIGCKQGFGAAKKAASPLSPPPASPRIIFVVAHRKLPGEELGKAPHNSSLQCFFCDARYRVQAPAASVLAGRGGGLTRLEMQGARNVLLSSTGRGL